jgi:hypothetical protein
MKKFVVLFLAMAIVGVAYASGTSVTFDQFKKIVEVVKLPGFELEERLTRESEQPYYKVVYSKGMMLTVSTTFFPEKTKFNSMDLLVMKDKDQSIEDGTLLAAEELEYKGRKAIYTRSVMGTYISILLKNNKGLFSVNYVNLDEPVSKKILMGIVDKIKIDELEK